MVEILDGFDFAAATLVAMVGRRPHMDDRLAVIAARLRSFDLTNPQDRITAAIVVESEARRCGLDDAEMLLEAAAAIRRGP